MGDWMFHLVDLIQVSVQTMHWMVALSQVCAHLKEWTVLFRQCQ